MLACVFNNTKKDSKTLYNDIATKNVSKDIIRGKDSILSHKYIEDAII